MLKRKISNYHLLPYIDTKEVVIQDGLNMDYRVGDILKLIYKTVKDSNIQLGEEKTWFVINDPILEEIVGSAKKIPNFYFALGLSDYSEFEKYFEIAVDQINRLAVGVTKHLDELFIEN